MFKIFFFLFLVASIFSFGQSNNLKNGTGGYTVKIDTTLIGCNLYNIKAQVFQNGVLSTDAYVYSWQLGANNTDNVAEIDSVHGMPNLSNYSVQVFSTSNQLIGVGNVLIPANSTIQAVIKASSTRVDSLNPAIEFTDASVSQGSKIVSWFWNYSDGGFDSIKNPTHSFHGLGGFNVSLKVTNTRMCSSTANVKVTVTDIDAFYIPNSFNPLSTIFDSFLPSLIFVSIKLSCDTLYLFSKINL